MRWRRPIATAVLALCTHHASAGSEGELLPDAVTECLACHVSEEDGPLDIIGIRALSGLPEEWQFLFEDAYDLDGDGVAGAMRYVSGKDGALAAKFGQSLAAARFEDFALIAGAAHDIDLSGPDIIATLEAVFEARSPEPTIPFVDDEARARFEARGCAQCHVTRTYEFEGKTYMPLSDFLMHDLGEGNGLRRTAPLWGCEDCTTDPAPHARGAHD